MPLPAFISRSGELLVFVGSYQCLGYARIGNRWEGISATPKAKR
jgi:hypothetical protein